MTTQTSGSTGSIQTGVQQSFQLAPGVQATVSANAGINFGFNLGPKGIAVDFSNWKLSVSASSDGYIRTMSYDLMAGKWEVSVGAGGIIGFFAFAKLDIGASLDTSGKLMSSATLTLGGGLVSGSAMFSREGDLSEIFEKNPDLFGPCFADNEGALPIASCLLNELSAFLNPLISPLDLFSNGSNQSRYKEHLARNRGVYKDIHDEMSTKSTQEMPGFIHLRRGLLVIDLDGDGKALAMASPLHATQAGAVQTGATEAGTAQTGATEDAVYFDLDGDGFSELSGWIGSDDGFLAFDRNGDGVIGDISELFGSETMDGFTALSALDTNGDGVITSEDADWDRLGAGRGFGAMGTAMG